MGKGGNENQKPIPEHLYRISMFHDHFRVQAFVSCDLRLRLSQTQNLLVFDVGMYRIPGSGSGSGWPDIRPFFSNPAPVPAKTVPSTGYLSRIVLGPFRQLVDLSSPSEWAPYCKHVHLNFKELVSHVDQLFYIY